MDKKNTLVNFLNFEKTIRHVEGNRQLNFLVANKTMELFPYAQALTFSKCDGSFKVDSVSATSNINENTPYLLWVKNELLPYLESKYTHKVAHLKEEDKAENLIVQWDEYLLKELIYCPYYQGKDQTITGGVLFLSSREFEQSHVDIVKELQLIFSQAYQLNKKEPKKLLRGVTQKRKMIASGVLMALVISIVIPVKQTILSPAEVSPESPLLISSPLIGAISTILVKPNQLVKKGDKLFELDDISLKNEANKAQNAFNVVEEKYRQAFQQSYATNKSQTFISLLKSEVLTAKNTLEYQQALLKRSKILSPDDGTIIFSSAKDWLGRPVQVGEKVMLLAKGENKQLDIRVPVKDMLQFKPGDKVKFFANVSPLKSIDATIDYISSQATVGEDSQLAFSMVAKFKPKQSIPAFGSHGTAKIYGQSVSLFYYLFRRPIIFMQSYFGL